MIKCKQCENDIGEFEKFGFLVFKEKYGSSYHFGYLTLIIVFYENTNIYNSDKKRAYGTN